MKNKVSIIQLNKKHNHEYFIQVARIHVEEIEGGFLARLGTRFLTRLYKFISSSSYSFLFIAKYDKDVVGFICGSTDTRKLYIDFVLRHGLLVLPYVLREFLTIKTMKSIFETVMYPYKKNHVDMPKSEILNFCVNKRIQRMGIGRKLFTSLIEEFQTRNVPKIRIVTGAKQHKAHQFYESLGARLIHRFEVHKGVDSLMYTFMIPEV